MMKIFTLFFLMFTCSFAYNNITKIEDFRQIDNNVFCAGVAFDKNIEELSENAGFIIFDINKKSFYSRVVDNDNETSYFTSYIHTCVSNGKNIFLLQAGETDPVGGSKLKLILHKVSQDGKEILLSKSFLSDYPRVYPCKIDADDGGVMLEIVTDESVFEDGDDVHDGPFKRKLIYFDDKLEFTFVDSKDTTQEDIFECYKSKTNSLQKMFQTLTIEQ